MEGFLIIVAILFLQQIIAIYCLTKLYSGKPKYLNRTWWNIIIVAGILIGPIVYLIVERKKRK